MGTKLAHQNEVAFQMIWQLGQDPSRLQEDHSQRKIEPRSVFRQISGAKLTRICTRVPRNVVLGKRTGDPIERFPDGSVSHP